MKHDPGGPVCVLTPHPWALTLIRRRNTTQQFNTLWNRIWQLWKVVTLYPNVSSKVHITKQPGKCSCTSYLIGQCILSPHDAALCCTKRWRRVSWSWTVMFLLDINLTFVVTLFYNYGHFFHTNMAGEDQFLSNISTKTSTRLINVGRTNL